MIIYQKGYATDDDFGKWYDKTDNSVFYDDTYEPAPAHDAELPPSTPEELIAQKQQKIARLQIRQRNDRIKPWEDKGKRFK